MIEECPPVATTGRKQSSFTMANENRSSRYLSVSQDVLLCPACGSNFLHHAQVNVYERPDGEDRQSFKTTVSDGTIEHRKVSEYSHIQNPSPRRDAITINFWCEICGKRSVLNIIQHKGETMVRWGVK
jgi:hypothetical protein